VRSWAVHPKVCCAQKSVFQTYNKNKNLALQKMCFGPQTFKPGFRPAQNRVQVFCPTALTVFREFRLLTKAAGDDTAGEV